MLNSEKAWGTSGMAWLTGDPGAGPDFSRSALLLEAARVADGIKSNLRVTVDVGAELTGRAALTGHFRRGRVSAGGATRLMPTADGWLALTLSRRDDIAAVPALVEGRPDGDPWQEVQLWAAARGSAEISARCELLDLPFGILGESPVQVASVQDRWPRRHIGGMSSVVVADLTSMWAGPLCGRILAQAGATVVKVESRSRPDGTRAGDPAVFDMLNHGKLSYAVDLDHNSESLSRLLSAADVVLEGSRPRALKRRGLDADSLPPVPGRIWLRITGYGPASGRPAFGDDAAVAGGLVGQTPSGPVFCGDAIADPLTALDAAFLVGRSLARGGGELIDVTMAGVAARYAATPTGLSQSASPVLLPARPPASSAGPVLGADNARVEHLVAQRLRC